MRKGFWKIGGKPVNPVVWGVAAFGIFYAIKRWSDARIERSIARTFFGQETIPASSTATVPPGKRWLVQLRNGDTTTMNSVQLQNAIESKAVKTYREIRTTQV